jgi:hypothetical protein
MKEKQKTHTEKYGVWHWNIECDIWVANKKLFKTAEEFLNEGIQREDVGWELQNDNKWSLKEVFEKLLPFVHGDKYIRYNVAYNFYAEDAGTWEFTPKAGRGHVPVWTLDMEEVEKSLAVLDSLNVKGIE